jgi:hypothetical protein
VSEEDVERVQKWLDEDWENYRKLGSNCVSDGVLYGKI